MKPYEGASRLCSLICCSMFLVGCAEKPVWDREHPPSASLETDPFELREIKTVSYLASESVLGPGGSPFHVKTRSESITQYPCSSCHQEGQALQGSHEQVSLRRMHVDISLEHASVDTMDCVTCHDPNDPGTLRTLNGAPVALDHAYQLCSQCHFEQGKDWAGGAHGKRVVGWKGKRVIYNCTECHDPHRPAFASRMPEPGPLLPSNGGAHHD